MKRDGANSVFSLFCDRLECFWFRVWLDEERVVGGVDAGPEVVDEVVESFAIGFGCGLARGEVVRGHGVDFFALQLVELAVELPAQT